jgi:hypothetical protein
MFNFPKLGIIVGEILKGLSSLLHLISPIPVIIVASLAFTKTPAQQGKAIFIWTLIALALSLILNVILFLSNKSHRKAMRYKEAYKKFTTAYKDIHMSVWESAEAGSVSLNYFCSNLAEALKHITGKECHVAIKKTMGVIENPTGKTEEDTLVYTIARDSKSSTERKEKRKKNVVHQLSKNTDFLDIFEKIQKGDTNQAYFFSNNLLKETRYHNSSLEYTSGLLHNSLDGVTEKQKKIKWDLEYKSTVVVPICKYTNEYDKNGGILIKPSLRGFFCIHSEETGLFEKEIDSHIIASCADALVNIVSSLPFKAIQ